MSEFVEWAQPITAIAAAIAAGVAIWQTRLAQNQFYASHRPWLGVVGNGWDISSTGRATVKLTNYGNVPAFQVKTWFGFQLEPFTKEMLQSVTKNEHKGESSIFPDSVREFGSQIDGFISAIRERQTIQMSLAVEYYYGNNKRGEYYLTGYYNPATGDQGGTLEWAK